MAISNKVNGKAKAIPSRKFLLGTSDSSEISFMTVKLVDELLLASAGERSESLHLGNITGARARLIADEWQGDGSKWTTRYVS